METVTRFVPPNPLPVVVTPAAAAIKAQEERELLEARLRTAALAAGIGACVLLALWSLR